MFTQSLLFIQYPLTAHTLFPHCPHSLYTRCSLTTHSLFTHHSPYATRHVALCQIVDFWLKTAVPSEGSGNRASVEHFIDAHYTAQKVLKLSDTEMIAILNFFLACTQFAKGNHGVPD